jgi:hypothetical protein
MAYHWQYAVAVGPLALYFFVLAIWHGGRYPRVVSGAADFLWLAFGVGGLVLFGPFGQAMARRLFGEPSTIGWLILVSASTLTLFGVALSGRFARRLVIYNADPATLDQALEEVLGRSDFVRTLKGFEHTASARGVSVEASRRSRTAVIEAFGKEPGNLIRYLEPRLVHRFHESAPRPSSVAWLFLGVSAISLAVPMIGWILGKPQTQEAFRFLLERISGGKGIP